MIMNFQITPDAEVRLAHLNVRTERHGDKDRTAIDLKLEWLTRNSVLVQFDPALLGVLYDVDVKPALPEIEREFTTRRMSSLAPLHWIAESPNRCLTIRHGIDGTTDLHVHDAVADHFQITAQDEGIVLITLRVRALCEDERVLGKLPGLLNRLLPMSLVGTVTPVAEDSSEATVWPFPKGKKRSEPKEYVTGEQ
jgi:hypothetical protein